jgi:hypothetical protein
MAWDGFAISLYGPAVLDLKGPIYLKNTSNDFTKRKKGPGTDA